MCSAFYFLWEVKFIQLVDATCITLKKSKTNKENRIIPSLIYPQIKSGFLLGFTLRVTCWTEKQNFCFVLFVTY